MEGKKGLVLCVDDEPGILRSLQWLLQKEFDVVTAPGGEQAIELLDTHDFDVVISDQRMPGMSGAEFLAEVRQRSPRALRILLTGYSDLQAILRSVNEGEIFRFINKPWNVSELPGIVAEAVQLARIQPSKASEDSGDECGEDNEPSRSILLVDDDPTTERLLGEAVGTAATILVARSLAEAIAHLDNPEVAIVIANTRVGNTDTTRLLKLLKQKYPQLVSIAVSAESDAAELISLINQGQIHRFLPKPIQPGHLRVVVDSALLKHGELRNNPGSTRRHSVAPLAPASISELQSDIEASAGQAETRRRGNGTATLVNQVRRGISRLFGA